MQGDRRNCVIQIPNKELQPFHQAMKPDRHWEHFKTMAKVWSQSSVADFIVLIVRKQQTSLKFAYIGVCVTVKCAQQFNLTAFGCMHPRFVNGDVGRSWKWEKEEKIKCKIMGWTEKLFKWIIVFVHVNEIPGDSFPIYFVVKRVTHKVLCVRPHHQSGWPPMSALLAAPAKPPGRKIGSKMLFFVPGMKEKFY